jgi:uncharacterized protein (TIGR02284 family)
MADFDNDEIISVLNDLIETCKDGEHGFHDAADAAGDSRLEELFRTYSEQRGRFASELQEEVRKLGGDPQERDHVSAAFHRGWMNVKSAVADRDDGVIISEVERGEDAAVNNYQEALRNILPSGLRSLIEKQFDSIQQAHQKVRELEITRKAG